MRLEIMILLIFCGVISRTKSSTLRRSLMKFNLKKFAPTLVIGSSLGFYSCSLYSCPVLIECCHAAESKESLKVKQNILMNPIFEGLRKADQIDFDIDSEKANAVLLLVPIVEISNDLEKINQLLETGTYDSLVESQKITKKENFQTKVFKKIFNRFADNIYYSDPDRANLYLGGGAVPDSTQTEKYLLRNEILTNVDNIRDDVDILLKETSKGQKIEAQALEDTLDDCKVAIDTMKQYFRFVDVEQLKIAKSILQKQI